MQVAAVPWTSPGRAARHIVPLPLQCRARPRPLPPAGPARTTESQHPAPNRAGGGQHQSAQPSMLEAAIASLPPHIQSAVAPPPVPPGADPICGPYYNKAVPPDILSVKVHKADEFRYAQALAAEGPLTGKADPASHLPARRQPQMQQGAHIAACACLCVCLCVCFLSAGRM